MKALIHCISISRVLAAAAATGGSLGVASGQAFSPETVPPTAGGPVMSRITSTATGILASPADFSSFARKGLSGPWSVSDAPSQALPNVSPFFGPDVVMKTIDGTILVSPKNRGIWRSTNDGASFSKSTGTGIWDGWFSSFEFGAVGFAKANNQLYAWTDHDEGNISNGHSGAWAALGSAGVLRSTDGGATWIQASNGLPFWSSDRLFGQTREQNKAFGGGGTLLLTFTNFNRLFRSVGTGVWQEVPERGGLPNFATANRWVEVNGFEMLGNAGTLAFVSYGGGIYRSTATGANAGTGFVRIAATGLPRWPEFTAWANTAEGLFVAVSPVPSVGDPDNFVDGQDPIPPAPVYPLYLSNDGGATFRPFGTGLDGARVTGITMLQDRVYVTTSNLGMMSAAICRADIAGGNQVAVPDNLLTADDVIVYLSRFFAGDARADIAGPNQSVGSDGQLGADDVVLFLSRFFAGC